jgi:predicted O-methyltransferase YrrM
MPVLGDTLLRIRRPLSVRGGLALPRNLWETFFEAPYDVCPEFQGPPGYRWADNPRGKDHPRYGRFVCAFAKTVRPDIIVEVGTDTGGTAVGWARALKENGSGRLVCVDLDAYAQGTFPQAAQKNIERVGLPADRVEFKAGNSRQIIPELAQSLRGQVGIYLVDGDHTYEGARADLDNGLPMVKAGGYILVHDIDTGRRMNEQTPEHPHPVYEAFLDFAKAHQFGWSIVTLIRKHLGVIQVR